MLSGMDAPACSHFLHSYGGAVSRTDGNSLVLRKWNPVAAVHHQPNAGRLTGVFHVIVLINVDDHLQPCVQTRSRIRNNKHFKGKTGQPGICQVGRLVRRPGGPPRQTLK